MVQDWFANNIFTYIVIGIFAAGLLVKCVISLKYRSLIRASKRMGTSKNKLMRVLRLKFETCYKIKLGVNNVDTFVDKYVYRHKFCGIRLYTWETVSGEFVLLCTLAASIFAILGVFYECGRNDILSTLVVGILGSAILVAVDYFVNIRMKRVVLRTNIKDYLENFLKARLESSEFSAELLDQYKKEYFDLPRANAKKKKGSKMEVAATVAKADSKDKKKDRQEIDDAIRRREAKKNELKELIAADKQKDKEKIVEQKGIKLRKRGRQQESLKEVPDKVASMKGREAHHEEIAASKLKVEPLEPAEKKEKKEFAVNISEEEEKIIEDILKEYLS